MITTRHDGHPVNLAVTVEYMRGVDADADPNGPTLVDEVFTVESDDSVSSAAQALRDMADALDARQRLAGGAA